MTVRIPYGALSKSPSCHRGAASALKGSKADKGFKQSSLLFGSLEQQRRRTDLPLADTEAWQRGLAWQEGIRFEADMSREAERKRLLGTSD